MKIEGKWVDGLMEGEMKVETHCGGWIEGYFSKGVPHGFQREFGPSDIRRHKKMLKFVGRYYRGDGILYSEKSVTLFTVINKVVIASRKAELKTYDLRLRTFVLIDSRGFRIEVW